PTTIGAANPCIPATVSDQPLCRLASSLARLRKSRWNDPTPTGTQGTFATTSKQSHSLNVMVMMLVTPLASMSTVTHACCRTTESSYLLGMTNIGLERCAIELRQPEITASA